MPSNGIGKEFSPSFRTSFAGLKHLKLFDLSPEIADHVCNTHPGRGLTFAPEWESSGGHRIVHSIGFYGGNKQCRIGRNVKRRLALDRNVVPYLCLPYSQQIFFVFMVDLDLPSIKVGLQSLPNGDVGVIDEQVGRVAIECVSVSAIAQGADDNKPQGTPSCATTPKNRSHRFIVQPVFLAGGKDRACFPGCGRILPQLFGSWEQRAIGSFSASASFVSSGLRVDRPIKTDIFADSSNQHNMGIEKAENRSIAEAGVYDAPQNFVFPQGDLIASFPKSIEQLCPLGAESSSCCLFR